jgi:glycosyltransferase involved in cell wall biosynthesis
VSVLTTTEGRTGDALAGAETAQDDPALTILRRIQKWDWSAVSPIRRALAETRADIYHIQYQTAAFGMHPMINVLPRLTGSSPARRVVTFHDLRPMYLFPKAGRIRDWLTFQLARASDAVIATNGRDRARLARLHLKRLRLIPIGSNIDPTPPAGFDRDALRAQLGVAPGETLLCYFGFFNESKGASTLIRALAEIPNARLVLLGGETGASDRTNAAYAGTVRGEINASGQADRVIRTSFLPQPEIAAHFLASDICVLPYRDGASYRRGTLMAALAHGRAIITTYPLDAANAPLEGEDGLPPLRSGENVLLLPPDDPHAIADAVARLVASPELRAHLETGARETARFFSWAKIAAAHFALYESLLSGS